MLKKIYVISFILILMFSIVACQSNEAVQPVDEDPIPETEEPNEEPTEEPIEEPVEEEPAPEPEFPYYAPLTGIGSMVEINDRIIAVMMNNHGKARPQSGLDQADMVYEILAEGWITRLVALYQSQSPEVIGPVRSIRPYLTDLATGFDAVFAHAGGSQEALNTVQNRGLASLDEIYNAGHAFYRVNFRKMPHNLYTNVEMLRKGADSRGHRTDSDIPTIPFKDPKEEMLGDDAKWIEIEYHSTYQVAYEYDPETQLYTRYVRGEPHLDMETEKALTTTNVFVIETSHRILDNVGRRAIDVMSEGEGYLFQRGKMQKVDWKRVDGVIRPMKDGEEVGLYPGTTWVNIIPNSPGLENRVRYQVSKKTAE
jgi:hypothetical protein